MDNEYVQCGQDIAKLIPTAELRWELLYLPNPRLGANISELQPILQQKWVASSKMQDGGRWEEHRWRDIPSTLAQS